MVAVTVLNHTVKWVRFDWTELWLFHFKPYKTSYTFCLDVTLDVSSTIKNTNNYHNHILIMTNTPALTSPKLHHQIHFTSKGTWHRNSFSGALTWTLYPFIDTTHSIWNKTISSAKTELKISWVCMHCEMNRNMIFQDVCIQPVGQSFAHKPAVLMCFNIDKSVEMRQGFPVWGRPRPCNSKGVISSTAPHHWPGHPHDPGSAYITSIQQHLL